MKKIISIFLFAFLLINDFSVFADSYDDIENHWAKETIEKWSNAGILTGYDGKFNPDEYITRGEFATVINRTFGFKDTSENTFEDLDDDFYTNHILCLNYRGIMTGFDNKIRPDDYITREEAVAMLFKALELEAQKYFKGDFYDINQISKWALPYVITFANEGYIKGNNGFLNPRKSITRAETVVLMDNTSELPVKEEKIDVKTEIKAVEEVEEGYDGGIIDLPPSGDTEEENDELKPTITTTLEDGAVHKNSRLVFDVIAKDKDGEKIPSIVKCNEVDIEPSWDDETKTSYTLEFYESGEYIIEVTATDTEGISKTVSYTITYEMAEYGEVIGRAVVSVEAFTVGGGYIVPPTEVEIKEGLNCAYVLDEILTSNNMSYMSSGSLDGGFYLSAIQDIAEFTPSFSESMIEALGSSGFTVDEDMFTMGQLSEFDFTQGSGWMYCVNGNFPNVGFSDYYLQDGDVLRIQFTLCYGADMGGGAQKGYDGENIFKIVNRDELTRKIAVVGLENCNEYINLITKPDITEDELNSVLGSLD